MKPELVLQPTSDEFENDEAGPQSTGMIAAAKIVDENKA